MADAQSENPSATSDEGELQLSRWRIKKTTRNVKESKPTRNGGTIKNHPHGEELKTTYNSGQSNILNSRFKTVSKDMQKQWWAQSRMGFFYALKEKNRSMDINSKSCKTFQKSIDQKSPDWNRKKTNLFKLKEGPKIFRILGNVAGATVCFILFLPHETKLDEKGPPLESSLFFSDSLNVKTPTKHVLIRAH